MLLLLVLLLVGLPLHVLQVLLRLVQLLQHGVRRARHAAWAAQETLVLPLMLLHQPATVVGASWQAALALTLLLARPALHLLLLHMVRLTPFLLAQCLAHEAMRLSPAHVSSTSSTSCMVACDCPGRSHVRQR